MLLFGPILNALYAAFAKSHGALTIYSAVFRSIGSHKQTSPGCAEASSSPVYAFPAVTSAEGKGLVQDGAL